MLRGRISGHLVRVVIETLVSAPVKWEDYFSVCEIPENILEDPDHFISMESLSSLLACAIEETGDEYLCLRYYESRLASLQGNAFGTLMRFATNIEEVKNLYESYGAMNEKGGRLLSFGESMGCQTLEFNLNGKSPGKVQMMDLLTLYSISTFELISGKKMPIRALDVIRSDVDEQYYIRHFGKIPIRKNVPSQTIYLDMEVNFYQFVGRDPKLLKLISSSMEDKLAVSLWEDEFLVKLRTLIVNNSHMTMTSEAAAAELGMSRSSLYRSLKELGTSYQAVYDGIRFQSAQRLLRNSEMPFWQISDSLGFSSEANFFRFFRRMGSDTPRKFRKKYRRY